ARAGADGDAISFGCEEYAISLPDIEEYIGRKIPVAAVDPALLAKCEPAPPMEESNRPPFRGGGKPGGPRGGHRSGRPGGSPGGARGHSRRGGSQRSGR
ncbi:MAG TPA: hypothetical protein VII41_11455, partial [Steroidobacteraceae bacterium]